jgi:hypothetical protein
MVGSTRSVALLLVIMHLNIFGELSSFHGLRCLSDLCALLVLIFVAS